MMNELSYYEALPDSMTPEELQRETSELLHNANSNSRSFVAEALCQLAVRYWHTYEILPTDYKDQITRWIKANWRPADRELAASCTMIVPTLGLEEAFRFLAAQVAEQSLPAEVRTEVVEMVDETGAYIADPYHSLRSLRKQNPSE